MKRKVFVKELDQFATVIETTEAGEVKKVEVETPSGTKLIDVLEKGYTVISTLKALFEIIINLVKSLKR